jgi:hypothetical protein
MEWLGSAEIDAIDSCSPEGGFMGQLWSGHRTAIDLLVSVERRSPSFALAAMVERGYRELKRRRDDFRSGSRAAFASGSAPRPGSHTAAVP